LGERHVRNVEVEGSNPLPSTTFLLLSMFRYLRIVLLSAKDFRVSAAGFQIDLTSANERA
jgi:hypothetical protein